MLECLLCLALSPVFNTYDEYVQSDIGVHVAIGEPFRAWFSYEAPRLQVVGQNVPTRLYGMGLGYEKDFGPAYLILEGGYFIPKANPKTVVRDEIVRTTLRNDHGPIPFTPTTYVYELNPGWGGRISGGLDITDWLSVFGGYRFFVSEESTDMCDVEICDFQTAPEGSYLWQNRKARSFGSVQVGVTIKL